MGITLGHPGAQSWREQHPEPGTAEGLEGIPCTGLPALPLLGHLGMEGRILGENPSFSRALLHFQFQTIPRTNNRALT